MCLPDCPAVAIHPEHGSWSRPAATHRQASETPGCAEGQASGATANLGSAGRLQTQALTDIVRRRLLCPKAPSLWPSCHFIASDTHSLALGIYYFFF